MKLTNSATERELQEGLINSKKYLLESKDGKYAFEQLKKICGEIKTAYVLTHTPDQGEDIYRILIDGDQVIGFEIPRYDGLRQPSEVVKYSAKEYERFLGGRTERLKLAVALFLSKKDMGIVG